MSGKGYLSGMGFSLDEVLKKAALPEDLFARQTPSLTAEEYFRFMEVIDALSPDEQTPVHLAASDGIEAFSPPIFAAYCSRNALVCLKRLAQYKPLIGALLYQVEETETEISVEILSANLELALPEILIGIEFVFLVGLIRKATKEPISPLSATVTRPMKNRAYADFIGKPVAVGNKKPSRVLKRGRACAVHQPQRVDVGILRAGAEAPPVDDGNRRQLCRPRPQRPDGAAAQRRMYRRRRGEEAGLQRRLQEEDTSFQKQLNHTRELLAKSYLANTDMTAEDIAFLLGYQEIGSFLRSFTAWTGRTIHAYRNTEARKI